MKGLNLLAGRSEPYLLSFLKKYKQAKAVQRDLTARFRARGHDFMLLNTTVREAMMKEAMVLGVEATMQHFDRIELMSLRNGNYIIEHYRERSQAFGPGRDDVAMGVDERLDGLARKVVAEKEVELETAKAILLPLCVMAAFVVFALTFWRYEIGLPLSIGAAILTFPVMGLGVALPVGYFLGKRPPDASKPASTMLIINPRRSRPVCRRCTLAPRAQNGTCYALFS